MNNIQDNKIITITKYDTQNPDFEMIQDALGRIGVELTVEDGRNESYMQLTIDTEIFNKATSRNAGRKQKAIKIDGDFKDISVTEVRRLMKEIGINQTAEMLGISRRTLYNRLKEAELTHVDRIF